MDEKYQTLAVDLEAGQSQVVFLEEKESHAAMY